MASEFRPSTPRDAPELVGLAERVLGVAADNPMFAGAHLHWKYWDSWQSSALPRSYVLVRDGRIVAHAGVLPLQARTRNRTLTLLHPLDWMSEPRAIGSGVALLQRLAKLAGGLLIVGGSAMTQRMVQPLGFRALGQVTRYAVPAREVSAGDDEFLTEGSPTTVHVTPRLTEDEGACNAEPESWLTFMRSPDQLEDFARCPATPMSVHTVRRDGQMTGAYVLALAPRQARVAAFWTTSPSGDNLADVARLARRQAAAHDGIDEVVCMANVPAQRAALAAAGFRPVGSVPIFLLASSHDIDADAGVGFQMLDGDVAFLHHGAPEPWL
jgi:hypothetical protein